MDENTNDVNLDQENEDKDLQKSLDDNLETMNDLLKSKKTYSKEDMKEMMKDKKNRSFLKEYMKNDDDDEGDDEDGKKKKEKEKMKKSFDDIHSEHDEIIDAVPILKSFSKVLEDFGKKLQKIEVATSDLQKSFDDNYDLQKSFGGVISSQSDLIKSIGDNLETIGNTPNRIKGKIGQQDLLKSDLDNDSQKSSKISTTSLDKVKDVLLKSFHDGEISSKKIAKWEQSRYNFEVFDNKELSIIESKL